MLSKKILSATMALGVLASLATAARAESTSLDTSFDAQKNSWYIWAGGVTAISGEDIAKQNGWLARVSGGYGQYSYNTPAVAGNNVDGTDGGGNLMIGYQYFTDPTTRLTAYLGADLENQHLDPRDPGAKADGTRGGIIGQLELEALPMAMVPVQVYGNYSTAFRSYWSQGNIGYNFGSFVLGPQLGFQGNESYNEVRYGARLSAIDLGFAQASLAVGGEHSDRRDASGLYGDIGFSKTF